MKCLRLFNLCYISVLSALYQTSVQFFLLDLYLVGYYNSSLSSPCNKIEGAALTTL